MNNPDNKKTVKILIVEDQLIIVTDLKHSLMKLGYEYISYVDKGKDAVKVALEEKPDIILMDIFLKDKLSGIDAAKIINQSISIPIIYITANSDEATLERAKETAPYGFITKPINVNLLNNAIQIALYKHAIGRQLEENEKWLNTTLDSIGDAVIATDNEGKIKFLNNSAEGLTGWEIEECLGKNLNKVLKLSGEKIEPVLNYPECFNDTEKKVIIFDENVWLITRGNKRIPVEGKAAPIIGADNKTNGCVIVITDISEKKRNEDRDILNQASLRVAIKNSFMLVFNQDTDLIYTWVYNFEEYFDTFNVLGKSDDQIFSSEDAEKLNILKKGVLNTGEGDRRDLELTINSKRLYFDITIEPLFNSRKKIIGITGSAFDITFMKQKELELIDAKEKAEKSDKLKTEFLAQISHEIRTPLNNIIGFTNLLKDEFEQNLPKGLEQSFVFIDKSAKRLIRTIDLILNLSKIQTGNYDFIPEIIDINELLDDLTFEFHLRAQEKGLKFEYNGNAKNKNVKGDRYSLNQAILNLADNAVKYTSNGSVGISTYNENEKLVLSIKDTGVGISKDFLPKLFSPFSREDGNNSVNYDGTGLGLALVKKYLESNAVDIEVNSKKHEGTEFKLIFDPVK